MIVALHDLGMAARYCDRIVLLDGGTVAVQGAPGEVLQPSTIRRIFGVDARVSGEGREFSITLSRAAPGAVAPIVTAT